MPALASRPSRSRWTMPSPAAIQTAPSRVAAMPRTSRSSPMSLALNGLEGAVLQPAGALPPCPDPERAVLRFREAANVVRERPRRRAHPGAETRHH